MVLAPALSRCAGRGVAVGLRSEAPPPDNGTGVGGTVRTGSITFIQIPVRDLSRAADFYAGVFGWSFEHDEQATSWFFTTPGVGPMGAITTDRPAARDGLRIVVAVDDVSATVRRAIAHGGGTADTETSVSPDVGEGKLLIDPDGNRMFIFHGTLGRRDTREPKSGAQDLGQ
jgi:predicted enzyme related to lactoylglutathione lyase